MHPKRLAGSRVVAGDDFVVAALLLRIQKVAAHREGRPARTDGPPPQLDRRRLGPVGRDSQVRDHAIAGGSAKTGPLGFCSGLNGWRRRLNRLGNLGNHVCGGSRERNLGSLCFGRSGLRRARLFALDGGLGQEPVLGSRRPPPRELGLTVAAHPSRSKERPEAAREEDGPDHRRPPRCAREATSGDCPHSEREAKERDRVNVEQVSHARRRDGHVKEGLRGGDGDDHEEDGADALPPGHAAEKEPPYEDQERAEESTHEAQ